MVTFTVLTILSLIAAVILAAVAIVYGAGFVVLFGDLIVFGLIMWGFIKLIWRKR